MGVASISIDSNIFSKVNIEKVADLEIAIREALLKANEIYDDKEFEETILEAQEEKMKAFNKKKKRKNLTL